MNKYGVFVINGSKAQIMIFDTLPEAECWARQQKYTEYYIFDLQKGDLL